MAQSFTLQSSVLPIISNLYEFQINSGAPGEDPVSVAAGMDATMQTGADEGEGQKSIYGYKVMVHPKMEKSHFLKQRNLLLFGSNER